MGKPTTHEEYEARRRYEAQQFRWNEIRRLLGPEACHTISHACRIAAEQFRKDMEVAHMPQTDRVAEQFHRQAKECEDIVERLEL